MRKKVFALMELDANLLTEKMNLSTSRTIRIKNVNAMVSGLMDVAHMEKDADLDIKKWIGKISLAC